MYTVIGYGGTRAFRLLWMLEEIEQPYNHDRVMPSTDEANARVPGGRLPALQLRDGTLLIESTAILNYLADLHDCLTHPPGTVERARQDAMIHTLLERIDAPLMAWTLIQQGVAPAPEPATREWILGRLSDGLEVAEEMLPAQGWLAGARFGIADIVLGHCLHWAERFHTPPRQPRLRAYLDLVQRRPAYRAADAA